VPQKEDVFYMARELYEKVVKNLSARDYSEEEFPLIKELLKNLSKNEEMILVSLLVFNPNKRPHCDYLLEYPFFKSYTPKKQSNSPEGSQKSEEINQLRSLINNSSPYDYETRRAAEQNYEKGMYSQKKGMESSQKKNKELDQSNNWWNSDLAQNDQNNQENESRVLRQFNSNDNQQKPPFPVLAKNSSKKQLPKFDTPKNPQKTSNIISIVDNENQENDPSIYRKSGIKKEIIKNIQNFSPYTEKQNYNILPNPTSIYQVISLIFSSLISFLAARITFVSFLQTI